MSSFPAPVAIVPGSTPSRAAVTFVLSAVYCTFVLALMNAAVRALPMVLNPLVAALCTVALLSSGLIAVAMLRVPELRPLSAIGLVRRPTADAEVGTGAAIGWAVGVALVLPALFTLHLGARLQADGPHLVSTLAATLLLLLFAAGRQLVLCGLPFRSLSQATSPLFASVAFAGIAAVLTLTTDTGDPGQALVAALAQLLFCAAAARTRAIWMGTALQFLWAWSVTVLFGLPSFLWPPTAGAVRGWLNGPRWATGSNLGPEAALWGTLVIVVAMVVLWRLTRDYAWHYTFDPITGAGYPMDVPPPAEHTRMEQAASAAPLVQIGGLGGAPEAPLAPSDDQR